MENLSTSLIIVSGGNMKIKVVLASKRKAASSIYINFLQPMFEKIVELASIDEKLVAGDVKLRLVFPFKVSREDFDSVFGPEYWEEEEMQRLEPIKEIKVLVPLNGDHSRYYLRNDSLGSQDIEDYEFNVNGRWDYIRCEIKDFLKNDLLELNWAEVLSYELVKD